MNWFTESVHDLRYALRTFRRSPSFALTIVLTLALAIGANTAVFSIVDAVLFKMLPVHDPQRLFQVIAPPEQGLTEGSEVFSFPDYQEMRDNAAPLAELAAAGRVLREFGSIDGSPVEEIRNGQMSGNCFGVLGVGPAIGRMFAGKIDREPERHPVAVISYSFWRSRFHRDPGVLGHVIRIRNVAYQIIGVTPPGFFGVEIGSLTDVWTPITTGGSYRSTSPIGVWRLLVRPKPGITEEQALGPIQAIYHRRLAEYTSRQPGMPQGLRDNLLRHELRLIPAGQGFSQLRAAYNRPLRVVMAVVAVVLLLACANIANLLLARANVRRREMAVRASAGASRIRMLRQLLTESLLLAGIASALGLLAARWTSRVLVSMLAPSESPVLLALDLDWRLLGFAGALCIGAVLLFGLLPAWRGSSVDLYAALKSGTHPAGGGARTREILVTAQVALSLVLVIGAALFLRTLRNLATVDAGFDARNLVVANVSFRGPRDDRMAAAWGELLRRVAAIPGVESAGLSTGGPFSYVLGSGPIRVPGVPMKGDAYNCGFLWLSSNYFHTMSTPLVMGRDFEPRDNAPGAPRVAIINEAVAREYFPNQNPVGKVFSAGRQANWIEIVGVAQDTKLDSLRESAPMTIYYPYMQAPPLLLGRMSLEVKSRRGVAALATVLRREAAAASPAFVLIGVTTQTRLIDETLFRERLLATVAGFFGGLALVLAAIGLYGTVSYTVTQRTQEIGIRMALGATRHDVMHMVMRRTAALVAAGSVAGLAGAAAAARLVASLLFGVTPRDPVTLLLSVAVLLAAALGAAFVPARRAARTDPMMALRYE